MDLISFFLMSLAASLVSNLVVLSLVFYALAKVFDKAVKKEQADFKELLEQLKKNKTKVTKPEFTVIKRDPPEGMDN